MGGEGWELARARTAGVGIRGRGGDSGSGVYLLLPLLGELDGGEPTFLRIRGGALRIGKLSCELHKRTKRYSGQPAAAWQGWGFATGVGIER